MSPERVPLRLRPRPAARTRVGSPRDVAILSDLALAGMLTTGQIERLSFPSRRRAQRRLRSYLDRGLVRAFLQGEAMHRDNVWTLAPAGLEFLEDRAALPAGAGLCRPRVRSQKFGHAVLVREVAVSLLAAERRGLLAVGDLRFDTNLAKEPVMAAAGVIPDGYAALEIADARRLLLWEAASASQPLAQVRAKLLAYERAASAQLPLFRDEALCFLFVLENRPRLARLERLAHGLAIQDRLILVAADELRNVGALVDRLTGGQAGFRPLGP